MLRFLFGYIILWNLVGMNCSKFDTAEKVWNYLEGMCLKYNFAKRYQLEMEIRGATQGDKSIQEFYNQMTTY